MVDEPLARHARAVIAAATDAAGIYVGSRP